MQTPTLSPIDCEAIANSTGLMIFQMLCNKGMHPHQAVEVVEKVEEDLRAFLEEELTNEPTE